MHARVLLLALVCAPALARADDAAALEFAKGQLAATAASLPVGQSPKSTRPGDGWNTVADTDSVGWTQGFLPGALWYLYDLSGDPAWRTRADTWTRPLEIQKTTATTHDVGFKMFPSFAHAYESTGDAYYLNVALASAGRLALRFDPHVGAITAGNWNPAWHAPVVIDTMMNIELLYWASAHGGDAQWAELANQHALKTLADLVRSDGSTFHVADYDPASGALLFQGTYQGYSDSSTWTRGQVWAIYGFTTAYRYTRDPRFLAAARKTADFYLTRLGSAAVPNWDFDAPALHPDTSAAAAASSALFALSALEPDAGTAKRYLDAANRMLDALEAAPWIAQGSSSPAVLLHGSGNVPALEDVDVGLIYGDFYFIEAIARRAKLSTGGGGDGGVVVGPISILTATVPPAIGMATTPEATTASSNLPHHTLTSLSNTGPAVGCGCDAAGEFSALVAAALLLARRRARR